MPALAVQAIRAAAILAGSLAALRVANGVFPEDKNSPVVLPVIGTWGFTVRDCFWLIAGGTVAYKVMAK